jgi:hypothetical protein
VFGVNEALWRIDSVPSVGGSIQIVRFVSTTAQDAVWGLARTARGFSYLPSRDCGGDVMEYLARVCLAKCLRR